ncbi:glycerol dehydrogenase [Marinilactibacillus psychrotolerans]|uniref:glycerol dehydrogenase n=1 Tax=Marinilactibacillus psychrotolerans TaxID=191770 RepID=UPI001C7DBE72|nr:glycerol dehydrogenase [Marinilactibacillus psychrotolerans]GEQ34451.1 glycerol dehydrogenase [Marinilactibacillus psychrotolerans]
MRKFIFRSPSRYIQGAGVINDLAKETEMIGQSPLLIADEVVWRITQEAIDSSFLNSKSDYHYEQFNGEASRKEIDRLANVGKEKHADLVIGVGGGKTLDTAKAIADELNIPVVIVPTTASTDAPTSALSVIYSDNGVFEGYKFYDKNPELVLIDSQVVINAPIRLFASGICDAMATLVEVKATIRSNGNTMAGGKPSLAAQAIAEMAEKILFKHGIGAYKSAKEGIVTPEVEAIVEANTLLSGLGFENGGLAGAHAIHNGFTALQGEIHKLTHGEKVAYGTLVQLVLEGKPEKEITKYVDFYNSINMPTTLKSMHLENVSYEDLLEVGKLATAEGETMENLDREITSEQVANAILAVDALSK